MSDAATVRIVGLILTALYIGVQTLNVWAF